MSELHCHSIYSFCFIAGLKDIYSLHFVFVLSRFNFISLVYLLMYVAGYFSSDVDCVTFSLNKELVDF